MTTQSVGRPPIVLVVGMHRSGTSAVTGALEHLGLALPRPEDQLRVAHDNPRGHFESVSLLRLGDAILGRLGGSWAAPPDLAEGFELSPALASLRSRARGTLSEAFPPRARALAWKDPRLCLLLPFWLPLLADRLVVILLVHRDPIDVAASLQRRDALELAHGLALWERYERAALAGASGLPVYVTSYEEALSAPLGFLTEFAKFLDSCGVPISPEALSAEVLASRLDPLLRHERHLATDEATDHLLRGQLGLDRALHELAGGHERFVPPLLEAESAFTETLLRLVREQRQLVAGLDWAARKLARLLEQEVGLHRGPGEVAGYTGAIAPGATPEMWRREARERLFLGRGPVGRGLSARPAYPLNATEDRAAYHRFLARIGESPVLHRDSLPQSPARASRREGRVEKDATPSRRPLFSVVMPVYRPPIEFLLRSIESVRTQTNPSLELCVCDDASNDPELTSTLLALAKSDRRMKVVRREHNGGISAATNDAIASASGEFIVFLDNDDELAPEALAEMAAAIAANPEVDLLYSDEDKIDEHGERRDPTLKPDFSPDFLASSNYLCHLTVVRRSLLEEIGGLCSALDGSQDYDLVLRASERARSIVHVPKILYHWRAHAGSAALSAEAKPWAFEAGHRALEAMLERRAISGHVEDHPRYRGIYHVRRDILAPLSVSIIITFRDEPAMLARCVASLVEDPGYDHFELVLVDNASELPETATVVEQLAAADRRVRLLTDPRPFSWSAINNAAAATCESDILLFLNNDIEARSPGWLQALVEHAQREEVGAVGARLLYPDGTIQHAGVVLGMSHGAAHVLQGLPGDQPGYQAMAVLTRNTTAVTGACLMTRRELFEAIGGFDEQLPVAFNDIDYCLRLRAKGLLVVYTPLAELIHYESKSRGHADDRKEIPLFRSRWREAILAGDPYYNPHLSRFHPWCPLSTEEDDAQWTTFLSELETSSKL